MPSKLGFGNTRKSVAKKVKYGSAMHYKSPIKNEGTTEQKAKAVELSKKHGNKPGFQEYLDKIFGGKTTIEGSTSYTRKKGR